MIRLDDKALRKLQLIELELLLEVDRICKKHGIAFSTVSKDFSSREDAIVWICANQLGRRNLTEESRKFLIGKQYESEKIVSRRIAVYQQTQEEQSDLPYETFDPMTTPRETAPKKKTAAKIADEHHISHGTVEKYSLYCRAIEEISRKEPEMAAKILSGRYKISHEGVLELAKRSATEITELNKRLERTQHPFAQYQTTRQEMQTLSTKKHRQTAGKPVSVKDMPEFDPDAEVVGLTLTIPSWSSSIDRIVKSNLEIVSDEARLKLHQALLGLQESITVMISAIKEDQ